MKKNQAQKFIVLFLLFLFAYSWRVEAQTGKEKQITMSLKMKGYPLFLNVLKKYRGIKFFLSMMKLALILLPEK